MVRGRPNQYLSDYACSGASGSLISCSFVHKRIFSVFIAEATTEEFVLAVDVHKIE